MLHGNLLIPPSLHAALRLAKPHRGVKLRRKLSVTRHVDRSDAASARLNLRGHRVTMIAFALRMFWGHRLWHFTKEAGVIPKLSNRSQFPSGRPFGTRASPLSLTVRGAIRFNVLVEPQHVVWVVLFLNLHEASIVRPVGLADKLLIRIA
jgi:hypothetical protein